MDWQQYMVNKVFDVVVMLLSFEGYEVINFYFKWVINVMKQMNYLEFELEVFNQNMKELEEILVECK